MDKHQDLITFQYFIPHRTFQPAYFTFYYFQILRSFAISNFTDFHNNFKMDAAETLDLIKGLTDIVQKQVDSMKSTDTQIQQLAFTVENLAKTQSTTPKPTIVKGSFF